MNRYFLHVLFGWSLMHQFQPECFLNVFHFILMVLFSAGFGYAFGWAIEKLQNLIFDAEIDKRDIHWTAFGGLLAPITSLIDINLFWISIGIVAYSAYEVANALNKKYNIINFKSTLFGLRTNKVEPFYREVESERYYIIVFKDYLKIIDKSKNVKFYYSDLIIKDFHSLADEILRELMLHGFNKDIIQSIIDEYNA